MKKILDKRQLKKDLIAFLNEMEKNLELFYVMEQRQFIIEGFLTVAWDRVKNLDVVKKHGSIVVCMAGFEKLNQSFKDHKEFEKWYASDMGNKTKENGIKLHQMKHALDQQLKGMEAGIILAGQELEKEMLRMGLLKS